LHSDTPTFALALRAALRQAPKVILVGEMRDRETIEIALEASETGHLVMSTLHTIDAAKTVERIVGVFPMTDQHVIRSPPFEGLSFHCFATPSSQKDGKGRIAAVEIFEIHDAHARIRRKRRERRQVALDAMRDGSTEACSISMEKLRSSSVEESWISKPASLIHPNAGNLRLEMADFSEEQRNKTTSSKASDKTEIESKDRQARKAWPPRRNRLSCRRPETPSRSGIQKYSLNEFCERQHDAAIPH